MHKDAISPEQRTALLALAPSAEKGFYLAGGTGLCLRLGHRRSADIDLFREDAFDADSMLGELRSAGVPMSNVRTQPNTVWCDVAGVPTSLMSFPHPNVEPPEAGAGVPVASLRDIAAMKIEAISSRGARRDFVDLYFACQEGLGLQGAVEAFERRFADAHPDVGHRLKALTYFDDAEREPEPLLIKPVVWTTVREFFESGVRALWNRRS